MLSLLIPHNTWGQNAETESSLHEKNITQNNAAKNGDASDIKLSKISAHATSTLPIYDSFQKNAVETIASTLARLNALKMAGQNLKNHSITFKGSYTIKQLVVFASYIFNATSQTTIDTKIINSKNVELLTVMVELEPDAENFDSKINKMLQLPDFFMLCEDILKSLTNLSGEAAYFIDSINVSNKLEYTNSNYVLWERIIQIANNIDALWKFLELLPHLETIWGNPKKIQKNLEDLILKAPNEALLWTALGEVQLQQDFPQDALTNFNKALLLSPKLARTLHSRGLAHLRLQHSALAEKDISDALELYPDIVPWLRSRGAVYMLNEEYDLMCIDFQRACALGDCDGLKLARKQRLCLNSD